MLLLPLGTELLLGLIVAIGGGLTAHLITIIDFFIASKKLLLKNQIMSLHF